MYLRCLSCLLIFAASHGKNHFRGSGRALDGSSAKRASESGKQANSFLLVGKREVSEPDSDFQQRPTSMAEHQKIIRDASDKTAAKNKGDSQATPITHSRLNDIHLANQGGTAVNDENNGRRGLTIERRVTKQCKGIKKIVQCKDDVPEEVCKQQLVEADVDVVSDMPNTTFFAICIDSEADSLIVAQLTNVAGVEDDPPRTLSYLPGSEVVRHLQGTAQVVPYGVGLVNAPDFWSRYGKRGDGVKVCVIDTGLRSTHEDIRDGDLSGSEENNFVTPWDNDGVSHGTHVTGTIAAVDNGVGVVGVAPDASIHVVRVFDNSGEFTASNLVDAMNACAAAGAKVISMSLGGPDQNFAERTVTKNLQSSGILLVAASGNDGSGINLVEYPAGYDSVMSVGALDKDFRIAPFSSFNENVDVAGPGVDVLSMTADSDRSYAELSGTSMATPHVSGVAALVWSQFPDSSVDDIRSALQQSARDFGACGKDRLFGYGMVDAIAAASYLENNGNGTPEVSGCVDVTVELQTDDFGQETTYIITPRDSTEDYVFRGGPYPNNRRDKYTDNIQLQDGCYKLYLLDSYGDGNDNPEYGQGGIGLVYNGNKQVDFKQFSSSQESFQFGNCGDDNPSPTRAPVPPPTDPSMPDPTPTSVPNPTPTSLPSPTDTPNPSPTEAPENGAACNTGESVLSLTLATDRWSRSENELYLFDDAAPDDEWIWKVERFQLQGNSEYEGSTCLNLSNCYKFYFFDKWGDGLMAGGLTLTQDGTTVLQVNPGDTGTVFQEGEAKTYWYQEFGSCTSVSANNSSN